MASVTELGISQPRMEAIDPLFTIVSLDFKTKSHTKHSLESFRAEMAAGRFVWIDVDISQSEEARKLVASLNLCAPEIVEDAMSREPATQIARYEDYIHLVLSGCRLQGHKFDLERVDAMMGENFLLTLHKGQPVFLEAVRVYVMTTSHTPCSEPSHSRNATWVSGSTSMEKVLMVFSLFHFSMTHTFSSLNVTLARASLANTRELTRIPSESRTTTRTKVPLAA